MKIKKCYGLILFLSLFNTSVLAQLYVAPQLEFVCELKVRCDPGMTLGSTAHGLRLMVPITGGTFEGPKLKGVVLSGGDEFEAPNDSKYDWMNNAIFVCIGVPTKEYVSIQVWKVL